MPRRTLKLFAPLLAIALFGLLASIAFAHPLGNFTINHYARLEPQADQMRVRYVLDFAEIPTFQEKQTMDADGNGEMSEAERAAFLQTLETELVENLVLSVDGSRVPLTVEPNSVKLDFAPGQGGLEVMRVALWLSAPLKLAADESSVQFRDENYAERLGWRELVAVGGSSAAIQQADVPAQDVSRELTAYPETMLNDPLNQREANLTVKPGAAPASTAPVSASNPVTTGALGAFDRTRDEFGKLLTDSKDLTPSALAVAFLAAMALGALHAFSPGHGKAVVGAYLVGSRGNWQHAVFLGLVVTVTHTAGVYALGFVTLFLAAYVLPEQLFPWLGFISGMLVALIGIQLLVQRYRAARSRTTSYDTALKQVHTHADGQTHAHSSQETHVHPEQTAPAFAMATGSASTASASFQGTQSISRAGTSESAFSHSHDFATPEEEEAHAREHLAEIQTMEKPSWKNLISLGISGGLLPCPSALVVMLSAIALGRVMYGLFLIVGFSLGLAGVLVLTGLALLYAGKFAGRYLGGRKAGLFFRIVPIVGAAFVTLLGLGIALESIMQTSFLP